MNEAFDNLGIILHSVPSVIVAGLGVAAVLTVAVAWWREKGHRDWS